MSAIIGALRGVLSLDSAAFDSGGRRAEATMGRVERRMNQFGRRMEGYGKRMSLGITAPLAGIATVAVKSSLSVIDAQAKMAQSMGTSTKSIQVLQRAGDLAGVSMGEIEQASLQLTKRLSQVAATGKGPAASALKVLHLRAQDLQKLPLDERIAAIQNAMEAYVPEAKRASVATELFGTRAGLTFTRIDTATLRTATDDVTRFGVAVSEVDTDQIERTNDAISRLGLVGRGIGNQLAAAVAPTLEKIADKAALYAERFASMSDGTKQAAVSAGLFVTAAGPAALVIGKMLRFAVPLVGVLGSLASPVGLIVAGAVALTAAGTALSANFGKSTSFAEAHEQAMDNVTIAMGDQINASNALSRALKAGEVVTLATVEAKIEEARARRAVISQLEAERRQVALTALGYDELVAEIAAARAGLDELAKPSDKDLTQMPALMAAGYEAAEQNIVRLLKKQQEMLALVQQGNFLSEKESANLAQIEANLAELRRRWNELNGITTENVTLTERGAVAAVSLAQGLGVAVGNASALSGFLSSLPGALASSEARIAGLKAGIGNLAQGGDQASASVAKYRAELVASLPPMASLQDGQRQFILDGLDKKVELFAQEQRLRSVYQEQTTALNKAASAGGSASKAVVSGLKAEITQRRKLLAMTEDQRKQYEAILKVRQRLGADVSKYSKAQITGYAKQLVALDAQEAALQRVKDRQRQWSDEITRTLFEGGNLGDTVKNLLKDIAYQFANTKIVLPIVASISGFLGLGGGGASAVASVAGGGAGGGGLLNGLLGNVGGGLLGGGGFLSGVGTGFAGVFSGGGLASSFANLGGLVSGVSGGAGALGAALPALGIVVAGISLLAKAFSRKYAGSGLRGTLDSEGFDGSSFDFYKGGWFRSNKTVYKDVPDEIQTLLDSTMGEFTSNLAGMADALNLNVDAAKKFTGEQFTIWTNGKTQEEIQEALNEEIAKVTEKMADLVLGTKEFTRTGETSVETLTRLSTSLQAVNEIADTLGHRSWDVSLGSASDASELVDHFGGLQAMVATTSTYLQNFYSEAERRAISVRKLSAEFDKLGVTMPTSRVMFRQMVEAIDTTTESGREFYARMLNLGAGLAEVLLEIEQYSDAISGAVSGLSDQVRTQISAAQGNLRDTQRVADLWYKTATTLRDFLADLLNTNLTAASSAQVLNLNRARFADAEERAKGGDVEAAKAIPELARNLLNSLQANAGSALEYRRAASDIQGRVSFLAGIADLEGGNEDVLAGLYQQQIDVLTNLGNFLQLEGLTDQQVGSLTDGVQDLVKDWSGTIDMFDGALGGIADAIKDAKAFSYNNLIKKLDLSINAVANAQLSPEIAALVTNAGNDLKVTLDFVVRSKLSAPDKWIAVNSLSEHVKTLDFVVGKKLSSGNRKLALSTLSNLRKNLKFTVVKDLDAETRTLALAGNSELSRVVNVALGQADKAAMRLALSNIRDYAVTVSATMAAKVPPSIKRMILKGAGSYAPMIEASLTQLSGDARRILLGQQGAYVANISAVLASDLKPATRRLLLNANTAAVRAVTIAAAYAGNLLPAQKHLLEAKGTNALRTIELAVNPDGLTAFDRAFLTQLDATGAVPREIKAGLSVSGLSPIGVAMMDQLQFGKGSVSRTIQGLFKALGVGVLGRDMLDQLQRGTGAVTRTIKGIVNLESLNAEQKSLLAAIDGSAKGVISLGGSIRFTPEQAFTTWYASTTQNAITTPMNALRDMLGKLRDAVDQDRTQRENALKLVKLQNELGTAKETVENRKAWAVELIGKIEALEKATSVQLVNGANDATLKIDAAGLIDYKATAISHSAGSNLGAWRNQFWADGGLEDKIGLANTSITNGQKWLDSLRAQIKALGGVPQFATGGNHAGGWRVVGERGWELEHTGPSRVISNSESKRMLDNSQVVAELRRVNDRLDRMEAQDRQYGRAQTVANQQTAEVLRHWERDGMPKEQV